MARIAIFDTRYSPKRCGVRGKGQLLLNDVVRTVSAGGSVIIHKEDCYSIKAIDKFFKAELLIIIINSLVSCFMLLVTSYFIFSGNEKLFISATFATLYLLCIVFVNYVFLLAVFVADEWLFNKTDAD